MRFKTYALLAVWFVLVASLVVGLYVPLHYWSPQLRGLMPQGVSLMQVSGHWWSGRAALSVPYSKEPALLSWTTAGFLSPISWQLNHPQVMGYGKFKPELSGLSLWIDGLSAQASALNPVLAKQGIELSGQPITVSRWFSHYVWQDHTFDAFKVQANWPEGNIRYPVGNREIEAPVKQWQLHGYLSGQEPVVSLRSLQGNELLEIKLLSSHALEMTVMPELIESLGQRWPGKKEYPAFVVVQPLNELR